MRSKGFTLIELLAVIVILAIIALIAVPIILGIIGDSKKESQKRSIDMYADAIKIAIAKASIKGEVPSGSYKPEADSKSIKLKDGDYTLPVDYDKSIVECETTELYKDGTIYLADCKVGGEDVEGYTYGTKQEKEYKVYKNGDVVYFDVKLGTSCTNYIEANSATGYKGIETPTETNNNCLKFYAFNDSEESDRVNLLLDHNTTALFAWDSSGSNLLGPSVAFLNQLKADTENWEGTESPTNYTYNYTVDGNTVNYTIDYSKYGGKARLITAEEIVQITGNTTWTVTDVIYYFDSNTNQPSDTCKYGNTSGCQYGWLYDRTDNCAEYGCYNNGSTAVGYWTATFRNCGQYGPQCSVNTAYNINYQAFTSHNSSAGTDLNGLRPVIEVLKSKLS